MSEMVERVGRALAKQEGYTYDPLPYDDRARAAIEAMREPLLKELHRIQAGENDVGRQAFNNGVALAATAVTAMLDAALT